MTFSPRNPPREVAPLPSEQRGELSVGRLEMPFIDRVVDHLPLSRGTEIPAADQVAHLFVADAFIEWFSTYRKAFELRLKEVDPANRHQLTQSYATMLEHVALREAAALPSTQDRWQRGELLDELEAAAEAFYRAILQHEGWIEAYGCIFGDDTPRERYDYLKLVNRARGFLRRSTVGTGERQHLRAVGLYNDRGVILPHESLQASGDPRMIAEGLAAARRQGQEARERYEDERSEGYDRAMELHEYRSRLEAAISVHGDGFFSAFGAMQGIQQAAQRLVELEGERRRLYRDGDMSEAALDQQQRTHLAALLARRAELKAFLEKAQTLLRLHKQAERLGVLPVAPTEPVKLSSILRAISA